MNATLDVRVLLHGEAVNNLRFNQPVIRIGRERDAQDAPNDIVLASKGVSRSHAQILVGDGGVTVIDRSRHGTFVNGERVQGPRRLTASDVVEIDAYTIQCELDQADGMRQAPPDPNTTAPELDLVPVDDELPSFDSSGLSGLRDLSLLAQESTPPPAATPQLVGPSRVVDAPVVVIPDLPVSSQPRGVLPPSSASESSPLALVYRELAAQHGAARWGQAASLGRADLPRATEAARRLIAACPQELPSGAPWPERLARELCGLGPLDDLLDDVNVTALSVRGTAAIQVRRGESRELAAARFSCVEAVHAAIERWTGQSLGEHGRLEAAPCEGTSLLALGRDLAPGGPIVHITRVHRGGPPGLSDLVGERVLPQAAADLLGECVRRGRTFLLHGDATADLSPLTRALIAARPAGRSVAVVRRVGAWDTSDLLVLAGERPGALTAARRLDSDWLVVEEVDPGDANDLCNGLRHAGGGTIATLRARSADAAITRLAAMFAAASGWSDLQAARAIVTTSLDVFIGIRRTATGGPVVHTIAEARPGARGELAELFTWNADIAGIHPTDVEIHLLR